MEGKGGWSAALVSLPPPPAAARTALKPATRHRRLLGSAPRGAARLGGRGCTKDGAGRRGGRGGGGVGWGERRSLGDWSDFLPSPRLHVEWLM